MEDRLKKILRAISLETRHILEGQNGEAGDLEQQLNRLGIWRNRSKPIEEMPHLSTEDREARSVVDAYLDFRQEADVAREDAVAEFIRESAYTWANRLFALRIMEARGIIDEVILKKEVYGGRSLVQNRFAKKNPEACRGEDDGLFAVLFNEFQERSKDIPDLFNPEAPATKLRPSVAALKRIIALLSGLEKPRGQEPAIDEVFESPDAFGWMYQYWNSEEKDKVFEKLRTIKGFKVQGSDTIPATQLYTEPYMVKFLVQNSLGATWMGMYPESKLFEKWEYFVRDADRASVERKPVSKITFMDPACGSGHFHIVAFDLFYDMYEEEGILLDPKEICSSILNRNLFGIDIDERAVQIAKAVLWMKAANRVPDIDSSELEEFHDHFIATNIKLPREKYHLESFLQKHPDDEPLKSALEVVFEGLQDVDELGSLVQIEEPVDKMLKCLKGTLQWFSQEVIWNVWKQSVISRLRENFAEKAYLADLGQAIFMRAAYKSLGLFDMLSHRYDVVATNPPYMGSKNMGNVIKKYIEKYYPSGKRDIYAAFILRCLTLAYEGGRVAMVTQHSWMFLQSFSDLRVADEAKIKKNNMDPFKGLLLSTKIETLAHLGSGAFGEIGGEIVNIVMFTLSNEASTPEHRLAALRLIGPRDSNEKTKILYKFLNNIGNNLINIKHISRQSDYLSIPNAPIIYWLNDAFRNLLRTHLHIRDICSVKQGIVTANNSRHIRWHWETCGRNWQIFAKGGGYQKWCGLEHFVINLNRSNISIASSPIGRLRDSTFFGKSGWYYALVSGGKMSVRLLHEDWLYDNTALVVFPEKNSIIFGPYFNSYLVSYLLRLLGQSLTFNGCYVEALPVPPNDPFMEVLGLNCISLKQELVAFDVVEYKFDDTSINYSCPEISNLHTKNAFYMLSYLEICASLHAIEGLINYIIFLLLDISDQDRTLVYNETGTPAGCHPMIYGHESLPSYLEKFAQQKYMLNFLKNRTVLSITELSKVRLHLRALFEAGPGAIKDTLNNKLVEYQCQDEFDEELDIGAQILIPPETFLEEISQKLKIHPISVHWLLKEGIEKDGWRCIPEEQRITKDKFTVIILRLLGHRWLWQIDAGEIVPDWADKDGVIPLKEGSGEKTLLERVHERIAEEFPGGRVQDLEREFEEIMEISLEKWLAGPFFKHHISQFRKRPIAWQIESNPPNGGGRGRKARQAPVFSCLVYYHRLDGDLLHKIRTQYVWNLRDCFQTELRTLENMDSPSNDQLERLGNLRRWIEELKDFDARLEQVSLNGFNCAKLKEIIDQEPLDKWTSRDGQAAPPATKEEFYLQEKRYDPDINDGVRVNIAPLQIAGLLSADVLAKKDLEKAIQDRAEWRADERRWCRQGKLPRPGWWKVDGQ